MQNERLKEISKMERRLAPPPEKKIFKFLGRFVATLIYFSSAVAGRVIEIFISSFIIVILTFPVLILLLLRKIIIRKNIFEKSSIFIKGGHKLTIRYFNLTPYLLRKLSLFPYVVFNYLSLVGVTIQAYESKLFVAGDSYLRNNRPGVFNLWYLRSSSRLTHEGREQIEFEYLSKKNIVFDLILILKSIPAAFYFVNEDNISDAVNLLDLQFQNLRMKDAVTNLQQRIETGTKTQVSFVNPDCFNKIFSDKDYYSVLQNSDLLFPDGIGVNIACKILNTPLNENINGTDMLPFLCQMAEKNNFSIFLLGGKPGIPDKVSKNLTQKFKDLDIAGFHDGYFDRTREEGYVIDEINQSKADILLVAFGAPFQEKWISDHKNQLNCKIMMGVGGLFDFFSGNIPRAPKWMREMGLEWIFRLLQEPKRMWRRYIIGNPLFLFRVLRWKFKI